MSSLLSYSLLCITTAQTITLARVRPKAYIVYTYNYIPLPVNTTINIRIFTYYLIIADHPYVHEKPHPRHNLINYSLFPPFFIPLLVPILASPPPPLKSNSYPVLSTAPPLFLFHYHHHQLHYPSPPLCRYYYYYQISPKAFLPGHHPP